MDQVGKMQKPDADQEQLDALSSLFNGQENQGKSEETKEQGSRRVLGAYPSQIQPPITCES